MVTDQEQQTQTQKGLKVADVLNKRATHFGIPSKYFLPSIVVTIFLFWKLPLIFAALFACVLWTPLYLIHADDPQGLDTLIDSLRRPIVYRAGAGEPLQLVLVRERRDQFVFEDPRSEINLEGNS